MSSNGRSWVTRTTSASLACGDPVLAKAPGAGRIGAVGEEQHARSRSGSCRPAPKSSAVSSADPVAGTVAGARGPVDQREVALAQWRELHSEDLVGDATGEVDVHRQQVSGQRREEVLAGEADLLGADRQHGIRAVRGVVGEEEARVVVAGELVDEDDVATVRQVAGRVAS